jgi:hypothetical protein
MSWVRVNSIFLQKSYVFKRHVDMEKETAGQAAATSHMQGQRLQ